MKNAFFDGVEKDIENRKKETDRQSLIDRVSALERQHKKLIAAINDSLKEIKCLFSHLGGKPTKAGGASG